MQITMAMPPVNRTRELYFAGLIFMVCQSTAKSAKIGPLKNFTLYGRWVWDFGLLSIILIHIHMCVSMLFYPFPTPLPLSPPYSLSVYACIGIHARTHMHAHMHMHVNIHTHTQHIHSSVVFNVKNLLPQSNTTWRAREQRRNPGGLVDVCGGYYWMP